MKGRKSPCSLKNDSGAPAVDQNESKQSQSISGFQKDLLELAIRTSAAIPVYPHIKDRSKAQALAAEACFELNQPHLALECINKIENWRRGAGYADYAFYCANNGANFLRVTHTPVSWALLSS